MNSVLSGDAYDAPRIWNDLPDVVHWVTSLHSFRKKAQNLSLFAQAYPHYFILFPGLSP